MCYIVSAVEEVILTGVLWLGSSVCSIDPIKFKQTRQLACSGVLRFTVLLTTKYIYFLGQSFSLQGSFSQYNDWFQGCKSAA